MDVGNMFNDGPFMNNVIGMLLKEVINERMNAAKILCLILGITTLKNVTNLLYPTIQAASSIRLSKSIIPAVSKRMTYGKHNKQ